MPAPVLKKPATPASQPAHITPKSKYSIETFLIEPTDIKPAATVKYSSELQELFEEMETKEGSELVIATAIPPFSVVPTGIFALDLMLGGGWADGFPSMVYGEGNSGKTTAMLKAIAGIQRKYPYHKCVMCDVETTFDPEWADKHGVDRSRLLILSPSSAEEGADIMLGLMRVPEIAGVFLDSIPVFVPSKDYEDSMSDHVMGTRARLFSRFSSNILQVTVTERQNRDDLNPHGHRFSWFAANSWREKLGVMFGNPETLPGGKWQHTFHRTKLNLRNKEALADIGLGMKSKEKKEEPEGAKKKNKGGAVEYAEHEFRVDKAKIPGIRNGEFRMVLDPEHPLGLGAIDDTAAVAAWAKRLGVVRQSGKEIVSDVFDYRLSSREEFERQIAVDPEFGDWIRLACIVKQRVYLKMRPLPPDGYLINPTVSPSHQKKPTPSGPPPTPKPKAGGLSLVKAVG